MAAEGTSDHPDHDIYDVLQSVNQNRVFWAWKLNQQCEPGELFPCRLPVEKRHLRACVPVRFATGYTRGCGQGEGAQRLLITDHCRPRLENDLHYNAKEKSMVKKRAWVPPRCLSNFLNF